MALFRLNRGLLRGLEAVFSLIRPGLDEPRLVGFGAGLTEPLLTEAGNALRTESNVEIRLET